MDPRAPFIIIVLILLGVAFLIMSTAPVHHKRHNRVKYHTAVTGTVMS